MKTKGSAVYAATVATVVAGLYFSPVAMACAEHTADTVKAESITDDAPANTSGKVSSLSASAISDGIDDLRASISTTAASVKEYLSDKVLAEAEASAEEQAVAEVEAPAGEQEIAEVEAPAEEQAVAEVEVKSQPDPEDTATTNSEELSGAEVTNEQAGTQDDTASLTPSELTEKALSYLDLEKQITSASISPAFGTLMVAAGDAVKRVSLAMTAAMADMKESMNSSDTPQS